MPRIVMIPMILPTVSPVIQSNREPVVSSEASSGLSVANSCLSFAMFKACIP